MGVEKLEMSPFLACTLLGCSKATLYRALKDGSLPSLEVWDVRAFLEKQLRRKWEKELVSVSSSREPEEQVNVSSSWQVAPLDVDKDDVSSSRSALDILDQL